MATKKTKLGRNQVVGGDCIEHMRLMRDNSVDHVITDPPFEAECHDGNRMVGGRNRNTPGKRMTDRMKLDFDAITDDQRREAAHEMVRISRGWVLVFCQIEAVSYWIEALKQASGKYRRTCIWHKTNAMPKMLGDGPAQSYETFVAFWAGESESVWNGGGKGCVWWSHTTGVNKFHPTEKPIPLMRDLIMHFTMPKQLICDPFAGAGSTGLAAKEAGRDYLLFEVDQKYAGICKRRLSKVRKRSLSELVKLSPKLRDPAYGIKKAVRKAKPLPGIGG